MPLPVRAVPARLVRIDAGTTLHRLHHIDFPGARFNPCLGQATRFAPLKNGTTCIPTFYAGSSFDGAAYETIFRGRSDPFKAIPRQAFDDRGASRIAPRRALELVPLFGPELLSWGLDLNEVFSPDTATYAFARALALQAWCDNPTAQGLVWTSVRDNSARAMMIFGDRTMEEDFDLLDLREVRSEPSLLADLRAAGLRAGLRISL